MGNKTQEKLQNIPYGITPEENARRKEIFNQMDVNGNGYLSLAEVDKGIRDVLELPELFDSKPVIMRGFQAAKDKIKAKNSHGDDYVSKAEFRYLLIYLRQYYEYWIDFEALDKNNDRRIGEEEFLAGVPIMQKWGIKLDDPAAKFKGLCAFFKETSHLTFTDFCHWVIREHLKQHADGSQEEHYM